MCVSLVSLGDFGFYFGHCSLWHTGQSLQRLFWGRHMMGDVGVGGMGRLSASGYLVCFFLLVRKTHAESWCLCCDREIL
jgi:hypothetical protein